MRAPGGIHVPVADLNGDGRPDFVALIAQQYEHVVAFLNRGPGRGFRQETIFLGADAGLGLLGIQLVDLDKDGDLDVLMTNGDTLDDFTIRPFHGVRWLENRGEYPFVQHDLVAMPGVHRAQAIDFDGDGDLDVFACAFLPSSQNPQFQNLERQGNLGDLGEVGLAQADGPRPVPEPMVQKGRLTHVTMRLRRLRRRRGPWAAPSATSPASTRFGEGGHRLQAESWVEAAGEPDPAAEVGSVEPKALDPLHVVESTVEARDGPHVVVQHHRGVNQVRTLAGVPSRTRSRARSVSASVTGYTTGQSITNSLHNLAGEGPAASGPHNDRGFPAEPPRRCRRPAGPRGPSPERGAPAREADDRGR